MKKILETLTLCSLVFVLFSCSDGKAKNDLLKIVNEINRECPIQYDMFTCQKAELKDNDLVLHYTVDEYFFPMELFRQNPEKIKKFGGSAVFDEDPELTELIKRSGCGYTMIYKGNKSNEEVSIHFSEQEIKDVLEHPASQEEILDWQIESSNAILPQQVDEVTTLLVLEKDGEDVSYIYEIDDVAMDFNAFKANQEEFRENLKETITQLSNAPQSSFKAFLKLLCRNNKNLCYTYRGKTTEQKVTLRFTNSELRDITKDYVQD